MTSKENNENQSSLILYSTIDGKVSVDVLFEDETVWLTQQQMADLFQKSISTINEHINNIFDEKELNKDISIRKFGNPEFSQKSITKPTNYYNLDVIISVGYRVKSMQGTKFRIWATQRLKEYIIKGFTLDDERLKKDGGRYFDELLERIREIRASERNFYQKITDLYATAIDYDSKADITRDFFAIVQNKMHYAITHKTAAEIISERADSTKPNMGLTSFKGEVILRSDIHIAKNYLSFEEIKELNLLVDAYLSFAELQAMNKKTMTMAGWIKRLDDYLKLSEKEVLKNTGKISTKVAEGIANQEFEKYKKEKMKNLESDFDKETKKYLMGEDKTGD